jgi:hypothetical protein
MSSQGVSEDTKREVKGIADLTALQRLWCRILTPLSTHSTEFD